MNIVMAAYTAENSRVVVCGIADTCLRPTKEDHAHPVKDAQLEWE